jgi:hypothetical protein
MVGSARQLLEGRTMTEDVKNPIATAPRNASMIDLLVEGEWKPGHWASSDGDGEQPAFEGFFCTVKNSDGMTLYHYGVEPTHWRPLPKD